MLSPALLHLLHLCDPAIPIGSFSHSSGLETYVQAGTINSKESAKNFIEQQLSGNIRHNDGAFVSLAWTIADEGKQESIAALDALCTASKLAAEMRLASQKTGTRLLKIFGSILTVAAYSGYSQAALTGKLSGHYCIAFGLIAHGLGLSKSETLTGFYYSAASGFTTNCVKLIPLGQQHGQEILVALFPLINILVEQSLNPDLSLIGLCCSGFDLACMQHEQLYSRLYMS